MTASTLPLVPTTPVVVGTGENAEHHQSERHPAERHYPGHCGADRRPLYADDFARLRAQDPGYFDWLRHITPAAGCTRPIRLSGERLTADRTTGQLLDHMTTATMPDGVLYKACSNRRASVCPSCAEVYRRDAYQLIRAGLIGGKGIPATVSAHPAVFATFVAPSFGYVHTRRTNKTGQQIPCRPRRHEALCPHGVDLRCPRIHADGERILGTPLCLDCYDHDGQVVFNHQAPELWRRTTIAIRRALTRIAREVGVRAADIRLSFGKVAEMQRRGVVHYHVIVRLDGVSPDCPGAIVPPPAALEVLDLMTAIADAAQATHFTTPAHPCRPDGWPMAWGDEGKGRYADLRPVKVTGDGDITDAMVAAYLAKYATKSTEATGHVSGRITGDLIDLFANPAGTHPERLVHAAWALGCTKQWAGLRRWAHMLGFGGHFLTKSRRYSVTFRILRDARVIWRRTVEHDDQADDDEETTVVISTLAYAGAGWRNTGDAMLANAAAAAARERERHGRDAAREATNFRSEENTSELNSPEHRSRMTSSPC
ncbi:replication initiator, partial [Actinoplanes sp. NPDC051633]|uniref:replication initiator n=1 Tax=Actinoplanes sp. NPDC051633 TaxID=3155670 RepID=UPI003416B0A7